MRRRGVWMVVQGARGGGSTGRQPRGGRCKGYGHRAQLRGDLCSCCGTSCSVRMSALPPRCVILRREEGDMEKRGRQGNDTRRSANDEKQRYLAHAGEGDQGFDCGGLNATTITTTTTVAAQSHRRMQRWQGFSPSQARFSLTHRSQLLRSRTGLLSSSVVFGFGHPGSVFCC